VLNDSHHVVEAGYDYPPSGCDDYGNSLSGPWQRFRREDEHRAAARLALILASRLMVGADHAF